MIIENLPFKPETMVFFAHDDGVKYGKVVSISCVLNKHAEVWTWQIEERTKGGRVIHQVGRNHIATTWEGMEDRLGLMYSHRTWEGGEDDDIFESK
jgi:hypothetical protein